MSEQHYIAKRGGQAQVVKLKLTRGIKPRLPNYEFIGPFDTAHKAREQLAVMEERLNLNGFLERKAKEQEKQNAKSAAS